MFAWGAAFSFPIFMIFYASNLYCLFLFTFVLVLRTHLPHHLHTLFVSCFIDENLTFKVDVLCLLVAHVAFHYRELHIKSMGWVFYDLFWLNINPKILFGVARKTISNMID
ncbi:hypothetical protein ACJX0J_012230, partial [Zea mays]